MLDTSGKHVGDRLDSPMRVPWESSDVVPRIITTKVIEKQERIEVCRIAESEGAAQMHAGTFHCWL
jgi:hypothetical protein